MDTSKPNPIAQALAAQQAAGEHPDADVLNAFAEGSLLPRERETVIAHLATCPGCREVLSVAATEHARELELVAAAAAVPAAAGAAVLATLTSKPRQLKSRAWLPFAAAACLAMATAAIVYFGEKKTDQMAVVHQQSAPIPPPAQALPESSKTVAVNEPPAAPAPGAAMEQAQRDIKQSQKSVEKDKVAMPYAPEKKEALAQAESRGLVSASKPAMAHETTQEALSATNQAVQEQQQIARQATTNADALEQRRDAPSARMQARAGAPAPATPAFHGTFAKSAGGNFIASPQWRISEQGRLERTFASGRWEPVLASEPGRMHVVSVVAATVWAGGENDALYRSQDEGVSWQKIALPQKNGIQHVIAHIRFENATTGTIEAQDGTRWTTSDGGATWK
jgi:hypothetical protein